MEDIFLFSRMVRSELLLLLSITPCPMKKLTDANDAGNRCSQQRRHIALL